MIKSTPKQHQDCQNTKLRDALRITPNDFSVKIIMGYASALRVQNTKILGQVNILLN